MISSLPLAWALTALFAVTGVYSLVRWSGAVSAGLPAAHRTAELAHVVMSAAMVVMTWTWYGTTGVWVQILLFGVFAAFFAVTAVRGITCGTAGRAAGAAHALMAAAMVWMLAAMPLIMPMAVSASSSDPHAGHHGGGSMDMGPAAEPGQAGWAVAVTVVLCVALLVAAGFWAVRAAGHGEHAGDPLTPDDPATGIPGTDAANDTAGDLSIAADDRPGSALDDADGRPGAAGEPRTVATTAAARPGTAAGTATAPVERRTPAPRASRLGAREDAACHAAMSAGMVLMLAAMVLGW